MAKYFTQGQAISFIEEVFGTGKTSNQGLNISVICPRCIEHKEKNYHKKKLVIRSDCFLVHCWVCGYKAKNLLHLIKRYHAGYTKRYMNDFLNAEDLFAENPIEEYEPEPIKLPDSFQLLATAKSSRHTESLLRYLSRRGIDLNHDLWYWRLGYTDYEEKAYRNRIIMPSFDNEGKLNYMTSRHIQGNFPKYLNPKVDRKSIIFNEINIDWTKELTLVEGPFDLMKCNDNATCVLGSDITLEYKLFQEIVLHQTEVVIAFDPDAINKTMKLARFLSEYNVNVKIFTVPSGYEDVGELLKKQFITLIDHATMYTSEFDLKARIAKIV